MPPRQEGPALAGGLCTALQSFSPAFLAFTSVTVEKLQRLVPSFEAACASPEGVLRGPPSCVDAPRTLATDDLIGINSIEHLGRLAERQPAVGIPALPRGCRGLRRTITPDLRVSPADPIAWRRLEEVGEDRLTVRVPDGLAVSLPRRLAPGQPWVGIVEWAVDAMTVHRGIRTYEATGFAQFSLDQFTNEHKW
jgi:hypothetical protein